MEGKMSSNEKAIEQRILVLDDQPEILEVIEEILKNYYTCYIDTAKNAVTALKLCEENEYQVICTDYVMPGINGEEFVQNLRDSNFKSSSSPILVITGNEEQLGNKMKSFKNVRVVNKVEQIQHLLEIFSQYLK